MRATNAFVTSFRRADASPLAISKCCLIGVSFSPTAIKRCEAQGGNWTIAELLRVNGELVLLQDGSGASMAETYF
jgi:hypothetical protein